MSNKELLPCPFCGGEARKEFNNCKMEYEVFCSCCDAVVSDESEIRAEEKWNARNSSEIPNSLIGEKIIDAIIENKLFSVINPRTNKEIEETLVVWAGNANEIIETVVCEQSCKEEKATCKKSLQVSRSDIEKMVKPLQWEDFCWVNGRYYLAKHRFIQFEENVGGLYDFFINDIFCICDVERKDIPQATHKFLVNLICSAMGVEE